MCFYFAGNIDASLPLSFFNIKQRNEVKVMLIFLFFAAKRETEKLAAATKSAKIMILKLNKKNSLRSDSFLFLTLYHHNFLTLFSRGGKRTAMT